MPGPLKVQLTPKIFFHLTYMYSILLIGLIISAKKIVVVAFFKFFSLIFKFGKFCASLTHVQAERESGPSSAVTSCDIIEGLVVTARDKDYAKVLTDAKQVVSIMPERCVVYGCSNVCDIICSDCSQNFKWQLTRFI